MPDAGTGRDAGVPMPAPPDVGDELDDQRELPVELVDAELRELRLTDVDAAGREATGLAIVESIVEGGELSNAALGRCRIRDVRVEAGSWANADASDSTVTRVEFRTVRLTGATFAGATLTDVRFAACRLDFASFRFATLERVRFEECRMDEADLYGAELSSVVFERCDLPRATLTEASFERCEMRGCDLDGATDPDRLRGVGMPWNDIVRSAPVFASAIGVRLLDDG